MTETPTVAALPALRQANKVQVAEFFDVSPNAVEAWVRRGCPVVERGGARKPWVFDLLAVAQWRYTSKTTGTGSAADPDSLAPQDRRAWYDGEKRRLEIEERMGQLIPVAEVEAATAQAFATIAQCLRAIPDNLERSAGVAPEVAEAVGRMIDDSMDALADRLSKLAPVDLGE